MASSSKFKDSPVWSNLFEDLNFKLELVEVNFVKRECRGSWIFCGFFVVFGRHLVSYQGTVALLTIWVYVLGINIFCAKGYLDLEEKRLVKLHIYFNIDKHITNRSAFITALWNWDHRSRAIWQETNTSRNRKMLLLDSGCWTGTCNSKKKNLCSKKCAISQQYRCIPPPRF